MGENRSAEYGWNEGMKISLHDKIKADLKTAMLNRENDVRNAIRVVMGEYPRLTMPITLESGKKTFRVKKPDEITDDDLRGVIRSLLKSEKSVLALQNKESSPYLELLELYLPRMITREEVEDWIKENIDFAQFNSPMQAIGTIMKHFGKLADGNMVKGVLQKLNA